MKTDAFKVGFACLAAFVMSFFIFAVPQGPYRTQLTSSLQLYVATTGTIHTCTPQSGGQFE